MAPPDRLQALLAQSALTGIDFVYVAPDQVHLDVHFLVRPSSLAVPLAPTVGASHIRIASLSEAASVPSVAIRAATWGGAGDVLHVETEAPGDFTRYELHIEDPRIDRFFNDVPFSFKANCESGFDCRERPRGCPPVERVDFPVDYQARDFWSFRRALLDFASLRYPHYRDRLEADVGVMLAEVMSAVGDEMAYYQDRVAREAFLETASQRRSLRRHARLVDYEIHDGLAAWTWLAVTVDADAGPDLLIPTGTSVWALSDRGHRIDYDVGRGLSDPNADYPVKLSWNEFDPYIWDESQTCLRVGATSVYIKKHWAASLLPSPGSEKWMLLRTSPSTSATPGTLPIPARTFLVKVVDAVDEVDALLGANVTRLVWDEAQALPFEVDLELLKVHGNLVPATAGRTHPASGEPPILFTIGPAGSAVAPSAVERAGPNGSTAGSARLCPDPTNDSAELRGKTGHPPTAYLFSLPSSESMGLSWVGDDPRTAAPEIRLEELAPGSGTVVVNVWEWRRSLLGSPSSRPGDLHFTLDDGVYRQVVSYWRGGPEPVRHVDYRSGEGFTIRFGDGEFGHVPPETKFRVTYRLGNGRGGNVAADTLAFIAFAGVQVTNPLPVTSGVDPEAADDVRKLAPQAYRAVTYRAVRPEDYAEGAERLPWVQRAGASFRWTGSWISAFVTPDPAGAVTVTADQRAELGAELDRLRQAGREVVVLDPVHAWLDLEITICVEPGARWGDVKERVLAALSASGGFFDPDRFTFGTPLRRSALEAAVQRVAGVRAVMGIRIRRRGWFDWQDFGESTSEVQVGLNEVIGVENDPRYPERGSVNLLPKDVV